MRRVLIGALLLCTSCAHATIFRRTSAVRAEAAADSLYWTAVHNLIPSNKNGSRDTAVTLLSAYLGSPAKLHHIAEATAFLALARDGQQLARVQAALQEARTEAKEAPAEKPRAETAPRRDDDAVKEISRLKDELARANDELDRIKKRLAAPPPKP